MTTKRRFKFNKSGGRGGGGSSSSTSNGGGGGDHDDFFQRNNTKIVLNRRQYAWAFFLSCCVIVTFLNWPLFSTTNNYGKVRGIIQSKPTTVRNMGIFPRVATISEMSWVSVRRNTLFHDVLLLDVAAADNLEMLESHNKKHKDIAVYGSSTFLRNVYSETDCTWDEWQVAYHPSCNDAHVIPMDRLFVAATGSKEEEGPKLTNLKRGGMRMGGTLTVDDNFSVLYKTQRIMKSLDFDQELPTFLFRAHKEAIIADVYTGATTKTFGHCGLYSLGEFGKGLSALKSRKKLNPVQKLSYAMQLAQSVTLLHNFDPLLPTIYKDFDPSNVVIVDDRALLVDFDQAEFSLKKNGKTCYPDVSLKRNPYYDVVPLELIPSSKQNETALLTEKTDVYGLGSLFFYILTDGARLYHCEKPTMGVCNYYFKKNNTISENEIITLKQNGAQPSLPKAVEDDDDPAISAIRESMKMALQKNPSERPAPKEILETLVKTCNNIGIGGCRSTSTSSTECKIRIAIRQKVTEPVYVTSYPGSGSELTLNLIEAFTGTKTINHGGRCCDLPERPYDYVALKTHYPWCCENNFTHGQLSNAIVLIRNPMSALPSKANRDYETDVGIRTHSKQCPESYWLKWRAKKFVKHLQLWEQLIYYWFETYSSSNRIILSYESLVDKDSGADVWRGVENFVVRTGAMKELSSGDTDCLWQTVVAGDKSGRKSEIHRLKSYKPSYTMEQHQLILDTLDRLLTKYRDESFGPDLALYKHKVIHEMELLKQQAIPSIAWLLSFPNSYNTQIRTLLQDVTNTTGGTNYGHERIYSGGRHSFDSVAVPILPGATNGPFVINTDLSLPPSDGFVLVKTHCGVNGCFDCSVPSPQNFLDSCASGTSTNKGVKYGVNVVQRAVHLYLNPLANVLTRFNGNSKKYPHTREGFLRWCDDYDDMYSSLKNGIPREILQSNVPCHAEFYKYINWHNNAISAIGILGLPLHTMYAEDFSVSSHNGAIHQLLTFLNLTQVMNGHSFETTNATVFFNTTQVKQIASFFKQHASDELLRQLSSRYQEFRG